MRYFVTPDNVLVRTASENYLPPVGSKEITEDEFTSLVGTQRTNPAPTPEQTPDVWDELAAAIREGVNDV